MAKTTTYVTRTVRTITSTRAQGDTPKGKAKPKHRAYRFITDLPFVSEDSDWDVPDTSSVDTARIVGAHYADQFIEFLAQNPHAVGQHYLQTILDCVDTKTTTARAGYWQGFLTRMEQLALAGAAHTH